MSTELTEQERRFLDEIAGGSGSLRSRIIPWALEIVPGAAFFTYGVVADRLFWEVFGFLSVVYFSVWRMYGQYRGRRMLQSIHKKTLATQDEADA